MNNYKIFKSAVLHIFCTIVIFTSCDPRKEFHDYYNVVKSDKTIYRLLRDSLSCNMFADAIDRAGYKHFLDVNNMGTVFAPTDEAFTVYLQSVGKNNVNELDSSACDEIVSYCILPDAYHSLDMLFSSYSAVFGRTGSGVEASYNAYRRYTMYRKPSYMAMNYISKDSLRVVEINNKYIPIFCKKSIESNYAIVSDYKKLTGVDLNESTFNVSDAQVLQYRTAINGKIYTINKVLKPIQNLHEYIENDDSLSIFKYYLDNYFTQYTQVVGSNDKLISATINKYYPTPVYQRKFAITLNKTTTTFPYNDETGGNTTLGNTYGRGFNGYYAPITYRTFFIPSNQAFRKIFDVFYKKDSLASSVYLLPVKDVIEFFVNGIVKSPLYPSGLSKFQIDGGGPFPLNFEKDVEKSKILTIGFVYVVKEMIPTKYMASPVSRFLMEPDKYTIQANFFAREITPRLTNLSNSFTVMMVPNDYFEDLNYKSTYTVPEVIDSARIFRLLVINRNNVDFKGEGFVRTLGSEFIYYNANKLQAGGNIDTTDATLKYVDLSLAVYEKRSLSDCYYNLPNVLLPAKRTIAYKIKKNFKLFTQLMLEAGMIDTVKNTISGIIADEYTAFVPNNEAIEVALAQSKILLPSAGLDSYGKDTLRRNLKKLIQNHFINTTIFTLDPTYLSSYTTFTDKSKYDTKWMSKLIITHETTTMLRIKSEKGVAFTGSNVNVMAKDGSVHEIDNILYY